jgi:hypothetical protein
MLRALTLLSTGLATALAARPGQAWVDSFSEGMKELWEGDSTSMSGYFAPNGRLCFNSECGGSYLSLVCF